LFIYLITDEPVIKLKTHPVNKRANIKGIIMLIIKSRIAKTKTSEKGSIKTIEMSGFLSINILNLFIS
tara:strand:+ start:2227 stop:2430 length:204 start_codon:yes stop_codon:yes gene_type:complete